MPEEKSSGGPAGDGPADVAEVRAIPAIVLDRVLWAVKVAWVTFPRSPPAYVDVGAWLEDVLAASLEGQGRRWDLPGGAAPGGEPLPRSPGAEGGGAAQGDAAGRALEFRAYRGRRRGPLPLIEFGGPAEVERALSEAIRRVWVLLPPERRDAGYVASVMRRLLRGCLELVKEEREILGAGGAPRR